MKITAIKDLQPRPRRVAIGSFDGVHLGHQAVIADSDTVVTFQPHPLTVVAPKFAPKLLTSFQMKAERIAKLGVEELAVIDFDERFAQLGAEQFVEEVLIQQLQAKRVSVGANFRFGNGAKGDAELLKSYDQFQTDVAPLLDLAGETVSSSRIRQLVQEGEVKLAADLTGSHFTIEGTVVRGEQRGRELGFPTANLVPDPTFICPKNGIYAAFANGQPAAVNVGLRPSFESKLGLLVEAYLIDFNGNLYGKTLRVEFLELLRPEIAFTDLDALIAQMHEDVQRARTICAKSATVAD